MKSVVRHVGFRELFLLKRTNEISYENQHMDDDESYDWDPVVLVGTNKFTQKECSAVSLQTTKSLCKFFGTKTFQIMKF